MSSTAYHYLVTKVVNYEESDYSSRATAFTKPMMPTELKVTAEEYQETLRHQVNLSWNYSFVADQYTIYRSFQEEGPYQEVGTTNVESYFDDNVKPETTYYYTVTQTANGVESVYSEVVEVTTSKEWFCGETIKYGEKEYPTIRIGNRCWFQENLEITEEEVERDCEIKRECYNCDLYGGLYDFKSASCDEKKEETRGICPVGWRVPSDDDWSSLEVAVGVSPEEVENYGFRGSNEASKLSAGYDLWNPGALRSNDDFSFTDFNILPGGFKSWRFYGSGDFVFFWSSTSSSEDDGCSVRGSSYVVRAVRSDSAQMEKYCLHENNMAYIRCVRSLVKN
jgi:uncharacterized protein (TIGR02145 family)